MDRTKPPPGWEPYDTPSDTRWYQRGDAFQELDAAWAIYDRESAPAVAEARAVIERAAAALEHLVGRGYVVEFLRAYLEGREPEVDLDES